jgi:antibiotic biosynthesis monooxygenase (ABM) superfamily enzyme
MYGTTMIGTLAEGVTPDNLRAELTAWEKERHVPGFQSSHVLVSDDGKTVINVAVFDSKESYLALADDPAQDAWWQQHFVPMLADEPRWVDGDWIS